MASVIEVKAQTRAKIRDEILIAINQVGQDNVIDIVMDEGGKFAGGTIFASIRAYVYYKD